MARFLSPLIVQKIGDRTWELKDDLEYKVGNSGAEIVVVPIGFKTDFASIPRAFWWLFPPDGKYTNAATLHDFLYFKNLYPRKRCDEIFLEAMQVLGVNWFTRHTIYRAVRMFGWAYWDRVNP